MLDALGGEDIQVSSLVVAAAEVSGLDDAFLDERSQAVVDFAEANTQLFCQLALGAIRLFLQQAQDLEVNFLVDLVSVHLKVCVDIGIDTLPPCSDIAPHGRLIYGA